MGVKIIDRSNCTEYEEVKNKIVITLTEKDRIELSAVIVDEDNDGALEFLKTRIAPKIPQKGTAPCDSSRLNPYLSKPHTDSKRE